MLQTIYSMSRSDCDKTYDLVFVNSGSGDNTMPYFSLQFSGSCGCGCRCRNFQIIIYDFSGFSQFHFTFAFGHFLHSLCEQSKRASNLLLERLGDGNLCDSSVFIVDSGITFRGNKAILHHTSNICVIKCLYPVFDAFSYNK